MAVQASPPKRQLYESQAVPTDTPAKTLVTMGVDVESVPLFVARADLHGVGIEVGGSAFQIVRHRVEPYLITTFDHVKGNSFKKELLYSLTQPGHSSKDHPIRRT